jgi:hypothetical protein
MIIFAQRIGMLFGFRVVLIILIEYFLDVVSVVFEILVIEKIFEVKSFFMFTEVHFLLLGCGCVENISSRVSPGRINQVVDRIK